MKINKVPAKYLDNFGDIEQGTDTPAKVMFCGLITDKDRTIVAHIHQGTGDLACFAEKYGEEENGDCRLCRAGIDLWPSQTFHVIDDTIVLQHVDQADQYRVELHVR